MRDISDTHETSSKRMAYVMMGVAVAQMIGPTFSGCIDGIYDWQANIYLIAGPAFLVLDFFLSFLFCAVFIMIRQRRFRNREKSFFKRLRFTLNLLGQNDSGLLSHIVLWCQFIFHLFRSSTVYRGNALQPHTSEVGASHRCTST